MYIIKLIFASTFLCWSRFAYVVADVAKPPAQAINVEQVASAAKDQISGIQAELKDLLPTQLPQIPTVSFEQIKALTQEQLKELTPAQLEALLSQLRPEELKAVLLKWANDIASAPPALAGISAALLPADWPQGLSYGDILKNLQAGLPTINLPTGIPPLPTLPPGVLPTGIPGMPPFPPNILPTGIPVMPTLPPNILPTGFPGVPTLPNNILPTGFPGMPSLPSNILPTGVPGMPTLPSNILPTGIPGMPSLPSNILPTGIPAMPTLPSNILPPGVTGMPTLPPNIVPTAMPEINLPSIPSSFPTLDSQPLADMVQQVKNSLAAAKLPTEDLKKILSLEELKSMVQPQRNLEAESKEGSSQAARNEKKQQRAQQKEARQKSTDRKLDGEEDALDVEDFGMDAQRILKECTMGIGSQSTCGRLLGEKDPRDPRNLPLWEMPQLQVDTDIPQALQDLKNGVDSTIQGAQLNNLRTFENIASRLPTGTNQVLPTMPPMPITLPELNIQIPTVPPLETIQLPNFQPLELGNIPKLDSLQLPELHNMPTNSGLPKLSDLKEMKLASLDNVETNMKNNAGLATLNEILPQRGLKSNVEDLDQSIKEKAKEMEDKAKASMEDLDKSLKEKAEKAKENIEELDKSIKEKTKEMEDKAKINIEDLDKTIKGNDKLIGKNNGDKPARKTEKGNTKGSALRSKNKEEAGAVPEIVNDESLSSKNIRRA